MKRINIAVSDEMMDEIRSLMEAKGFTMIPELLAIALPLARATLPSQEAEDDPE